MKLSGPPARRTPLSRGSGPSRGSSGLTRGGRLSHRSDKQVARDAEIAEAILAAKDRDGWRCQADRLSLAAGCSGPRVGIDGQHLVKRGLAPAAAADVRLIVALCRLCHNLVDTEPLLGQSWGLVVPAWVLDRHGPARVRATTVDLRYQLRLGEPMFAPWLSDEEIAGTADRDPRYRDAEVLPWPAA